jgi:membrane-associated protein
VNITQLLDAQVWIEALVNQYGPVSVFIVCGLLFAETGLLVGFFLPGDSILFPMGLMMATGNLPFPLWAACLLFATSAWLGDQTGYWLGRRVGPAIFNKPQSKFFNHRNVERAHAFFERYGAKAIILAHFVPVMRTFIPVAAGVGEMPWRRYLKYNFFGVCAWAVGVTLLGAALGQIPFVRDHVIVVTLTFLFISTIPLVTEFLKARRERRD